MARIRGKNTQPEIAVRKLLFSIGYRYRIHRKDLPGTPDIVFPTRRKVIFVNGCFWHQHDGCHLSAMPQSNSKFWEEKLSKNVLRDKKNIQALEAQGWKTLVIWSCEVRNLLRLKEKLEAFLSQS